MKRKGQIILVTMLAVFFLASTVQARGERERERRGSNWWKACLTQMWKSVGNKVDDLEDRVAKVEKRSKRNKKKIKKIKNRMRNRWQRNRDRNRGNKPAPAPAIDIEALKAEVIAAVTADMKGDEVLKAELKGEPGEPAEWELICPGCNFSSNNGKLIGFDFTNAYVSFASFKESDVRDSDFTNADCKGAWFLNSIVEGTTFEGAYLDDAYMAGTDWTGVDLSAAASVANAIWVFSYWNGTGSELAVATCPDGTLATANGDTCINNLAP